MFALFVLVLLPIVLAQGWYSYRTAMTSAEQFQLHLAREISERIHNKVTGFFDLPQRVVALNTAYFRDGQLDSMEQDSTYRFFLPQLSQQASLTFLSMGFADGQYIAASRTPIGDASELRVLQSLVVNGRVMDLYKVDPANRLGERISRSSIPYDARIRPWFKAGTDAGRAVWYPAYHYHVNDKEGDYDALGIGVAAPVYNGKKRFMGVLTADVSLLQMSKYLNEITRDSGAIAFLADDQNQLMASSTPDRIYSLKGDQAFRINTMNSPNVVIRAVSNEILQSAKFEGDAVVKLDAEHYLINWWRYQIPDGPIVNIAVALPQSRFAAPVRHLLNNTLLSVAGGLAIAWLVAWFLTRWLVRPLSAMGQWASQLDHENWKNPPRVNSPITELRSLFDTLTMMVKRILQHTETLEAQVVERTSELNSANEKLNASLKVVTQANQVAEQALADQRQFIAMVSHEFRSPLSVIDVSAQLLTLKGDDTESAPVIARIRRGVARLTVFVDNCLTQERFANESFVLRAGRVNLNELADWASAEQTLSGHVVVTEIDHDLKEIEGDTQLLRILVSNLLSNAVKYSPLASEITLRIHLHETYCRIEVIDQGQGILADELPLIFKKYVRGSATSGIPGAGLGLTLVTRIVNLHGGSIDVQSTPGKGSRFVVEIPIKQPAHVLMQ